MITLEGVHVRYGGRQVLRGVDLTLTERRVAVIGSNGSGKSTLARLLNGLTEPSSGRILVDGLDVRRETKKVRELVGFVFQNPDAQILMPTVAEDVAFSLKHRGLPAREVDRRVARVLGDYGLSGLRDHPAHLLSGGEKQLLALAAVMVAEPRYIVFDEPTTMLDLRNKRRFAGLVRSLEQYVIMVSHDLDLLDGFERVILLHEGEVAADGPPGDAVRAYLELMAAC